MQIIFSFCEFIFPAGVKLKSLFFYSIPLGSLQYISYITCVCGKSKLFLEFPRSSFKVCIILEVIFNSNFAALNAYVDSNNKNKLQRISTAAFGAMVYCCNVAFNSQNENKF